MVPTGTLPAYKDTSNSFTLKELIIKPSMSIAMVLSQKEWLNELGLFSLLKK